MRIIVGISGASGVRLGYEMLGALRRVVGMEIHLVVSEGARRNFELETDMGLAQIHALADFVHSDDNLGALISSGSFITDGMVVIPCSMKTLSAIAHGYGANLLVRAADVCLKEGRKVVLVPREMPFSLLHLRNMQAAAEYGCVIVPPLLTFYNGADSLTKQLDHIIGKVMMQFGLASDRFRAWQEPME
jgi:4-hydroxy-3-polyprenylbenzoate decarboxylase